MAREQLWWLGVLMVPAMKHDMLPKTQNHLCPALSFVLLAEYDLAIHKILRVIHPC